MYGPPCPSTKSPIPPQLKNKHWHYMILLLCNAMFSGLLRHRSGIQMEQCLMAEWPIFLLVLVQRLFLPLSKGDLKMPLSNGDLKRDIKSIIQLNTGLDRYSSCDCMHVTARNFFSTAITTASKC